MQRSVSIWVNSTLLVLHFLPRMPNIKSGRKRNIADLICHTLKTGIPVEEGDSILMLMWRVSRPEIQLGVGIHSELDFFFYQL